MKLDKNRDSLPLDAMEAALVEMPQADCPVVHRFAPGMYIREITIPAGTMLTSMTHRTEHPFVISKGAVYVITEEEGRQILEAPYTGITKPGTRRAIYAERDTVWTTFHATGETDIEKICHEILEPHENKLIEDKSKMNQWRQSLPDNQSCLS